MVRSAILASSLAMFTIALPNAAAAGDVVIEVLLKGLTNPCGVAVRPGDSADRYEVFVADSGAGRILRLWNSEPKLTAEVVTGFALATLGEDRLSVGPIGLLFLDRSHLCVGASGDDSASVRMFEMLEQSAPLSADQAKQHLEISADSGAANHVNGMVRSLANDKVADALVLTGFTNNRLGGLRKIPVRAGTLGEVQPFAATEDSTGNLAPAAIAIDGRGYIVVSDIGSLREPRDSRLVFYSPLDGQPLMNLSTDLYDILGLVYSPKTENLYAVDAAWMDTENGGVFRVNHASQPGKVNCLAVKIADVVRPSALAFGPDGALYVTGFGEDDDATPGGVLLKITGEL